MLGLNDIYATIYKLLRVEKPAASAQNSISFAKYIRPKKEEKSHLKLVHTPHNDMIGVYNLEKDISTKE
eukprot:12776454-Ditylum_brightwellii.AAC.1